jgi:hypothetical protein
VFVREGRRIFIGVRKYPSPSPWKTNHYRPSITVFIDPVLLWSDTVDERTAPDYESTFFVFVAVLFGKALKMRFP